MERGVGRTLTETRMTMTSQAKYDHVPLENASLHPVRQLLYLVSQ